MRRHPGGGLKGRRFFVRGVLAIILLWGSASVFAAGDAAYLAEIQARAQQDRLAADPAWLRLVHYEPRRIGGGWISAVTDPDFFTAPEGRRDPAAELDATLASFFGDEPRDGEPPQCRLRARYNWLKSRLAFDPQRLNEQACERFEAWQSGLAVEKLALVFASADLNAPSTMFGHTLLRLDAHGQGDRERLLAYAVNYAALTGPDAGLLYAVQGLGGGYDGYFGLFPYYEKVKEYVRIEYRDLWEYPLELGPEDGRRLLEHLWELRGIGIAYYFLSRNCSYQLLAALEAIRPDLHLTHRFRALPPYAIPLDTLRELQAQNLLGEPEYRPSLARQLKARYAQLPGQLQRWALAYADARANFEAQDFTSATSEAQALALEFAHELLLFRFLSDDIDREKGLPLARAALLRRSRIAQPSAAARPARPAQTPESSHRSGRLSAGLQLTDEDQLQGLLTLRPAYHDRLDPPHGYMAAGEIEFLAAQLDFDDERVWIDRLKLLGIEAIAERDALFQPGSWVIDTGLRRLRPLSSDHGALGAYFDGGRGLAWGWHGNLQMYGLALGSLEASNTLEHGHDLAAGLRLGVAGQLPNVRPARPLSWEMRADWLGGIGGAARERARADVALQYSWNAHQGLRLDWRFDRVRGDEADWTDGAFTAQFMLYF